jgi:hypothetical protein
VPAKHLGPRGHPDYRRKIDNPIGIEELTFVEELPVFGVLNVLGVGFFGAVASVVLRL